MSRPILMRLREELLKPDSFRITQVDAFISDLLDSNEKPQEGLEPGKTANPCFECGEPTQHDHHVVPRLYGGTKTIPLCTKCHGKAHSVNLSTPQMTRLGLAKARAAGKILGRRRTVSDSIIEEVKALRKVGATYGEISARLGISKGSVCRALEKKDD